MSVTTINRREQIRAGSAYKWITNDASGILQETTVTANKAVASDTNGLPVASTTTATQLGYLQGLTSLTNGDIISVSGGNLVDSGVSVTTPTFTSLTLTNPLTVPNGGTGNSTLTAHAVLLGEGTSAVAFAGPGTTAYPLVSNGASSDPSFQQLSLTAGVTGTLPIANGGTNSNASLTNGYLMVSSGGKIVTADGSNYSMHNGQINFVADPTSAQDAATKNYVDMAINGLTWKSPVAAATTQPLQTTFPNGYTYNNGSSGVGATLTETLATDGAFVIDGYTASNGDRVLIKNETTGTFTVTNIPSGSSFTVSSTTGLNVGTILHDTTHVQTTTITAINYGTSTVTVATIGTIANGDSMTYDDAPFNGIYTVTAAGNGSSTAWVLTRATDSNTPTELEAGTATFSTNGTANADKGFVQTTTGTITIGTSDLVYITFTSAVSAYFAGSGLDLTGSTFSISTDTSLTANAANSTPSLVVNFNTTGGVYNSSGVSLKLADASLQTTSSGVSVKEDPAGAISTGASGIKVDVDGTTIQITSDQLSVKLINPANITLADANIIIGNGSSVGAAHTVSGDATITDTGVVSIANGIANHLVTREAPSGAINGSNVTFTLAHTPAPVGSEMVFLNGLLQESGAGNDYTISGATITYLSAPQTGDTLYVTYWY